MHSSRVHTVHCSGRLEGRRGCWAGGVGVCLLGCLAGGMSALECLPKGCLHRGVSARGFVCQDECLPDECLPRGLSAQTPHCE